MKRTLGEVLPQPSGLTEPFWRAAREERLEVQRCSACGRYSHPPQNTCRDCGSSALVFESVSGFGRVYTFTTNRQADSTAFDVPYTNVIVELDEQAGLFLTSFVAGERPEWVVAGHRVSVRFQWLTDKVCIPLFGPADE